MGVRGRGRGRGKVGVGNERDECYAPDCVIIISAYFYY